MRSRQSGLRAALRLSIISVLWSGAVGGLAIAIALGSGSLSLLGFGVDAAVDAAASVALIWRFVTEARHPARAARAETIAERLVGAFLLIFAIYLVAASVQSLVSSRHSESSDLALASPYNTRIHKGLPPTPIGNPGLASIQAAAHPAAVANQYYVVKPGSCGQHAFSSTFSQFKQDAARYNNARAANGGKSPTSCAH